MPTIYVTRKESPIRFIQPMVKATRHGIKDRTRRLVSLPPWMFKAGMSLSHAWVDHGVGGGAYVKVPKDDDGTVHRLFCPKGGVGDRMWIQEAWRVGKGYDDAKPSDFTKPPGNSIWYDADGSASEAPFSTGRARSSMFMPRWASRTLLEITDVRLEWLNDITDEECRKEGIYQRHLKGDTERTPTWTWQDTGSRYATPRDAFRALWEELHGQGSWAVNPMVWVIIFKDITKEDSHGQRLA